jgi:SAM-dependent methyltransferase
MTMDLPRLKEYFIKDLGWDDGYQSNIVFNFLCNAAKSAKGGVVLDAGAGYQRYKPFFSESVYLAQEHPVAGVQNKNIRNYDILCDIKKIPLAGDTVDVVLSTSSLEHFRDPELFFGEAHRVLKPGKSLWIYVPFAYHEHEAPFDFQRPTRYGMSRWYEDAGFERIEVAPMSSSTTAVAYLVEYAVDEEVERECGGRNALFESHQMRQVAKKFCDLLRKQDRGPFPGSTLPIGWVAVGYKKGSSDDAPAQWSSARDFLQANALADPHVRFENGSLIYSEK